MRFWDASAVIPLILRERATGAMLDLLRADSEVATWWGTETECVSAVARLEREGHLTAPLVAAALGRLDALRASWHEVQPVGSVRVAARRLLRAHALRASDALQLGAALAAAEGDPTLLDFVCMDNRLSTAAAREGFTVLPAIPE